MVRLLLLLLLLVPRLSEAESAGIDSREAFTQIGCGSAATGEELGCHQLDANPMLMVAIDGPSRIDLGDEGDRFYTASIPPQETPLVGAGINVALDAPNQPGCTLEAFAPLDKMVQQNSTLDPKDFVLSHAGDGEPPANLVGQWTYQFLVLGCVEPGAVTLRVAMNAFDFSGDEVGEEWNSTTLEISVPEPGATLLGVCSAAALAAATRIRRRS